MARLTAAKRLELETFWRAHIEGWRRSELNQREYCEAHGLPLKRFGNWRAKFKDDDPPPRPKLLWRRGGTLSHMSSHMTDRDLAPVPTIPAPAPNGRRCFSEAAKRRIAEEASRTGASVSAVARRYGVAPRVLFRWKRELAKEAEPVFLPVQITDGSNDAISPTSAEHQSSPAPAPIIIERQLPGIEIELVGGRRVRFDRDADPEAIRRMIAVLEEHAS